MLMVMTLVVNVIPTKSKFTLQLGIELSYSSENNMVLLPEKEVELMVLLSLTISTEN